MDRRSEDSAYAREVLDLPYGETEDTLDERQFQEARELGIELLTGPATVGDCGSSCVSTTVSCTSARRSASTGSSRGSVSTGLSSVSLSRSSRETHYAQPLAFQLRGSSRPALGEHEAAGAFVTSTPRRFSSVSPIPNKPRSNSNPSLSYDSPRKSFSMKRGFNKLSKSKRAGTATPDTGYSPCDACPNETTQDRPLQRLLCQHSFCRKHLRELVCAALLSGVGSPPQCCGQPIPFRFLQAVLSIEEQDLLYRTSLRPQTDFVRAEDLPRDIWMEAGSQNLRHTHSGKSVRIEYREPRRSTMELSKYEEAYRNLECALQEPTFVHLRRQQENERTRFLQFHAKRRQSILNRHALTCEESLEHQNQLLERLIETHTPELSKLEDRHVAAEMDLRNAQRQEQRSCLVALRHMEAYCNSTDASGLGVGRIVSEQDRRELERQYALRDKMDHRHESAINVLREQQAKQMCARAHKQEVETATLKKEHETHRQELHRSSLAELDEFDEGLRQRQERLIRRWNLAVDIWRRRRKQEGKSELPTPIAPIDWPKMVET